MKQSCSIVLPMYKTEDFLASCEKKLLERVSKVFSKRKVFLVVPKSLVLTWNEVSEFEIISFDDYFFTNIHTYSELLCRKEFYNSFSSFQFIQIIQLDCWIFEDRLDEFMNLGFDYIGAPWMREGFSGKPERKLWKVGNGGFSLRKISSFLSIIDQIDATDNGKVPVFKDHGSRFMRPFRNMGFRNNLKHYLKKPPGEDIFWTHYVPKVFDENEFKVSDPVTGAFYSFEVLPEFLLEEVTMGKLPMGCHNWMNNNPDFWSEYIPCDREP